MEQHTKYVQRHNSGSISWTRILGAIRSVIDKSYLATLVDMSKNV